MKTSNFLLRRNQALLAEARTNLVLSTRRDTPRERRAARRAALELAEAAKKAIAREFAAAPEDVPWGAATGSREEIERLIEENRKLRESGASSLDAWGATVTILATLEQSAS